MMTGTSRADDDEGSAEPPAAGPPTLSAQQQRAVGLESAAPVAVSPAPQLTAYGQVLDSAQWIADAGQIELLEAQASAADTDSERLDGLYRQQGNTSLRAVQAAQVLQLEARTRLTAARIRFESHWGAVARLGPRQRDALMAGLASGEAWLIRADLPGRQTLAQIPKRALVELDGVALPAEVLGLMSRTHPEVQGVGLLLHLQRPPPGLAVGLRLRVRLEGERFRGLLVPASALLYGDTGPYVYREAGAADADGLQRYEPVAVDLLQTLGEAWVVSGLQESDRIVIHGAGVLWSLQGLGSAAEDDDD